VKDMFVCEGKTLGNEEGGFVFGKEKKGIFFTIENRSCSTLGGAHTVEYGCCSNGRANDTPRYPEMATYPSKPDRETYSILYSRNANS